MNSVLTEKMDKFSTQTLVLFDNIPITDQEQIYSYNPLLLKKIDVYLGHYIFGGQRFDGILSFSTYKGNWIQPRNCSIKDARRPLAIFIHPHMKKKRLKH